MGLAVPPEPQLPASRRSGLRGTRANRRPVRDDARATAGQRPGNRRIVGHGRDGRARTAAARASAKSCSARGIDIRARRSEWGCPRARTSCSASCNGLTWVRCRVSSSRSHRVHSHRAGWPSFVNAVVVARGATCSSLSCGPAAAHPDVRSRFASSTRDSPTSGSGSHRSSRFAVRRDAPYLQWKYLALPHIRYDVVALDRGKTIGGYAVFRHLDEAARDV